MTWLDGLGTNRLITEQDEPGIRVTRQGGPNTKRLMKRSKFGYTEPKKIVKSYFQKVWRIKIEETKQGRVSESVALASQDAGYVARNVHM